MTEKAFERFLKSIGGVESGFFPDREPITNRWFFGIGDGWLPLVKELITKLIELRWNKELCQVKEKFGGLRFYINSGSDEIHALIHEYENKSFTICETCGKDGKTNKTKTGWIKTLCEECAKERNA